jgi:diphosphomevalonate decarboxylase
MSLFENTQLILESEKVENGSISWKSPSNIALIKYWGKYGNQLPRNPSLSFTLEEAHTIMNLEWSAKERPDNELSLKLFFNNLRHEPFEEKLKAKLSGLANIFPFINQLDLVIDTANSFPHSAGIASSASSMSALALCLCSMEDHFFGTLEEDKLFEQKASFVSRLLSGSACRSIYGTAAIWGEIAEIPESADLYAIPAEDRIHPVFKDFQNSILIVSADEKAVSSSEGHRLMENNPYANSRYAQAKQRLIALLQALETGDVEKMGHIAEEEALSLHALMMTSTPSYLLLEPATLLLIQKIRRFRQESGIPAYFTLDAGPNIHLLYPSSYVNEVNDFIISELSAHCADGMFIADQVGEGPVQL